MATFGKTAIGGTGPQGNNADGTSPCKFTLSEAGSVTSITWYGNKQTAGVSAIKFIIYANDGVGGTEPIEGATVLGVTSELSLSATEQWWTASLTAVALSAGTYWLSWTSDNSSQYFYDAGGTNQRYSVADTYSDGVADPCPSGGSYANRDISIYATYTPTGGGATMTERGVARGVARGVMRGV